MSFQLDMKNLGALALAAVLASPVLAEQLLFKHVNVFDGNSDKLITNQDVLVDGETIKSIGKGLPAETGATVIDGKGRTLMPGLIDGHAHVLINRNFNVGRPL